MVFPVFRDGADYKTNHTISFEALQPLETDYISETNLDRLMREQPPLMRRTLNTALDILDLYTFMAAESSFSDSLLKVCNMLYLLGTQITSGVPGQRIPFSQTDLADACGCSRPQTSKQLGYLSGKGIISTHRGYLEIHNYEMLKSYCSPDVLGEQEDMSGKYRP